MPFTFPRRYPVLACQDPIGASSGLRRVLRSHLELVVFPDAHDTTRWHLLSDTEFRAAVRIVLHLAIDAPEGTPLDAEEFLARLDVAWMRRAWHGHRRELELLDGLANKRKWALTPSIAHFAGIYTAELAPWSTEQRCVDARRCFTVKLPADKDPHGPSALPAPVVIEQDDQIAAYVLAGELDCDLDSSIIDQLDILASPITSATALQAAEDLERKLFRLLDRQNTPPRIRDEDGDRYATVEEWADDPALDAAVAAAERELNEFTKKHNALLRGTRFDRATTTSNTTEQE